jgi:hypothetical protein
MTAAQPDNPVMMGVRSLEVRWIFPGQLETAVAGWFARFLAESESREDAYLLRPYLDGLSVKIRGGGALEVKVHRGSPGILDVAERAQGRMESWQKWSFPCGPLTAGSADPAGWRLVRKRRRIIRFPLASGQSPVPVLGPGPKPGCAVELTEVVVAGETWWSLGFEATGPAEEFHSELEAAAALVFAQAPPDGTGFGLNDSRSFAEWLRSRPGSE